jgi:hypothetical protein
MNEHNAAESICVPPAACPPVLWFKTKTRAGKPPLARAHRRPSFFLSSILYLLSSLSSRSHAQTAPSQEDVFRSISSNVSGSAGNGGSILLLVVGGLGVLLLLAYLSRRGERVAERRVMNHSGKLLREVRQQIGLKPAELKQLKLVSEQLAGEGEEPMHPLTLVLCPSLLVAAIQNNDLKIDRAVLSGLVRRIGTMTNA